MNSSRNTRNRIRFPKFSCARLPCAAVLLLSASPCCCLPAAQPRGARSSRWICAPAGPLPRPGHTACVPGSLLPGFGFASGVGKGHALFPWGTDRNPCHFFLPCRSPKWWGSCVSVPSLLADGAGISESARELGQLCQCFDTVGCGLKPELPVKCSDQEKCLYLTWIHIFHMELNSWHIPQALWGSQGFGVWGDAGAIPVLWRLGKDM